MGARTDKINALKDRALEEIMWEMLAVYDEHRAMDHNKIEANMRTVAAAELVLDRARAEDAKEYAATHPPPTPTFVNPEYDPLSYTDDDDSRA